MENKDFRTPGQLIEYMLTRRGWTQRLLAVILGADETGINKIVGGKRTVDAEMALKLGEVFDLPAEQFLNLQKEYDLAMARIVARPDVGRAKRALLFGGLPVSEMIKRGWLNAKNIREVTKVESELVKFIGVVNSDVIEIQPHAAKKTMGNSEPTPPQLAWLYRVKGIAEELLVGKFSKAALEKALPKLHKLTIAPEEARKVPRILAECGIRFVIVEALPGSKIDGVCFWLDNASPVIGISIRHDRIDNFWFVLRHELEHVRLEHGRSVMMLDTDLEGEKAGTGSEVPNDERLANAAAQEYCVPKIKMDSFVSRKAPFFSERDLLAFAKILGVHSGIVAGQLQHRTGRYDRFRKYLTSIRSNIVTGAAVDGWGDIYPLNE